jgi:hypothetical protein
VQVGELTATARVHYPIAALRNAGLWELDVGTAEVPNAHGSSIPQRWFDKHQPRNGLVASVYTLVRDSPEARAVAVRALVEKYFVAAPHAALLSELGLSASPAEMAFSDRAAGYRRRSRGRSGSWPPPLPIDSPLDGGTAQHVEVAFRQSRANPGEPPLSLADTRGNDVSADKERREVRR